MKKVRVLSTAFLGTLGVLTALTSCGKTTDSSHTIKFYNTCGDKLQTIISTAITEFQTQFPEWTVKSTQVGGYDDVYTTCVSALQANTQPDIAYCYGDHVASYLSTGKVLDLNDFINSTATVTYTDSTGAEKTINVGYTADEVADFVPGYYNEGLATNFADYDTYGYKADSLLTLPFSKSTEVMYYNADALKEAGLSVPTTWDEVWEACEVLREVYPKCIPFCYDSEANWFINMCEQAGWDYTSASGDHYLFNNSNTQGFLSDLKEYYVKGYIETQTTYGGYTSNLFTKGAEEGCIFCIGSTGGASYQATDAFEWGVAQIPTVEGKDLKVISQGPSICMFDQDNDEKELMSWIFVKKILEPAFQASFSMESGYNPVRLGSYEIDEYSEFLADTTNIKAVAATVSKQLSENNSFYTSPCFKGSATARTQVGSALVYVLQGKKTAAKALTDALSACK